MQAKEIQTRLGENLKVIRKLHKLTQFELAEKANVSEDTIKSIELSRFWPSEKTLAQVSEALGIDVYHLFMPTPTTVSGGAAVKERLREAVARSFHEYVEEVLVELEQR